MSDSEEATFCPTHRGSPAAMILMLVLIDIFFAVIKLKEVVNRVR